MTPPSDASAADFGSRFSAFIIDAALLFTGQWILVIVLSRQLQAVGLTSQEPCGDSELAQLCEGPSTALWLISILVLLGTTIGYHAFFEGRYGATPGKKWMGLRVVSLSGLHPLGFAVGSLRSVVRQAFWLSLFFVFDASPLGISLPPLLFIALPLAGLGLIAYAAIATDGRGVHDLVAGTQVVRSDQVPAPHSVQQTSVTQTSVTQTGASQTTPDQTNDAPEELAIGLDDNSEESV